MAHRSQNPEKSNQVVADRFELHRLLVAKNSVKTWKAFDTKSGELVLLKLLPAQICIRRRYWSRIQQILTRTGEWQHRGVLSFHHIEQTSDPFFFICSRYLDGQPLKSLLEKSYQSGIPLPLDLNLSILRQVASILDHAHAQRIGHFSLKPGNLFLCPNGTLCLTDFLIASEIRLAQLSHMHLLDFSNEDYYYLSPEQLNGQIPTKHSDLFSLASLAYHLLTGTPPDYMTWKTLLANNPSSPVFVETIYKEINASQCEKISRILSQGLSLSPDDRFSECRAFVEQILHGLGKHILPLDLHELYHQWISPKFTPDAPKEPTAQRTELPRIIVQTQTDSHTEKTDLKAQPSRNRKKYAWLINLLLLICIGYVAYGKRDMLRQQFFPSNPENSAPAENQTPNPVPPFSSTPPSPPPTEKTKKETPPSVTPIPLPSGQVSYESLRQPHRQEEQSSEHEASESAPDVKPFSEDPNLDEVSETIPQTLIDQIKSDASVVYESGFTPTSWDIQESMIAELAKNQIPQWQQGAEQDIPEAYYLLAWCHRQGYENIKKRNITAFELFLKAAEAGFPPAQFDLAYHCYESGVGTTKSKTKANQWLHRAAENGERRALFFQAVELLNQGQTEEAEKILQKLAQKGFMPAKKRLENMPTK